MGMVAADIVLINAVEHEMSRKHLLDEEEVRRMTVNMVVDSGSYMMCINENIQEYLNLPVLYRKKTQLANGEVVEYEVVGPIHVKFKNREATCNAFVLPGSAEPLLGAIPMEEMDVVIHPNRRELVVHPDHPDGAVLRL